MRYLILSLFTFLFIELNAQDPIKVDSLYFTTHMKKIGKPAELTIAYHTYNYWNHELPWYILRVDKRNFVTKYISDGYYYNLKELKVNQDSLKRELGLFYKYDIFSLKYQGDWISSCDSCNTMIFDGSEYLFVISTKKSFSSMWFYEPGYFTTCCTKLFEAKRIVDIIDQLVFW